MNTADKEVDAAIDALKERGKEIEIANAKLTWLRHTSMYARMVQSRLIGSHPERNIYGNIYRH